MDRPEHVSSDGKSVTVGGLKWFPRDDLISIGVKELNFTKRFRGKNDAKIERCYSRKIA